MIRSRCRWISVYLPWRTAHCLWALPFFCSIVSIAFIILSIAQLWYFYLASTFIVFWERDITSENHGTPVHLHIIVHTLNLLSVPLLSLALILCKRQGRRNWQLLCTRWEQSYLYLCAVPCQAPWYLLVFLRVLLETNLGIFTEGNCRCTTSQTFHLG